MASIATASSRDTFELSSDWPFIPLSVARFRRHYVPSPPDNLYKTLSADALHNEETMRVTMRHHSWASSTFLRLLELVQTHLPPPHSSICPNVIDPRRRRRIKADETAYYSRVNCENKTLFISEK